MAPAVSAFLCSLNGNHGEKKEFKQVLGLAIFFESYSFYVAFKVFQSAKGEKNFWLSIHTSKDPTTFTVLFEDSAGLLGLIVAFFGVYLAHFFDNPYFDGAASIVIGIILALVAVLLAYDRRASRRRRGRS